MATIRPRFPQSAALACWLLLFTLAASGAPAQDAAPTAMNNKTMSPRLEKMAAAAGKSQDQGTTATQPPSRRAMIISGSILSLPQDARNAVLIDRYFKKADTVSTGTMDGMFFKDPACRLIMNPKVIITDGMNGTIQMDKMATGRSKTGAPAIKLDLLPKIQPDGRIQTNAELTMSDGKSVQKLKKERLIRPDTGLNTFIGTFPQGKNSIYLFLTIDVLKEKKKGN